MQLYTDTDLVRHIYIYIYNGFAKFGIKSLNAETKGTKSGYSRRLAHEFHHPVVRLATADTARSIGCFRQATSSTD
jgi:hypothetical protein